jgi:hypothetical protein
MARWGECAKAEREAAAEQVRGQGQEPARLGVSAELSPPPAPHSLFCSTHYQAPTETPSQWAWLRVRTGARASAGRSHMHALTPPGEGHDGLSAMMAIPAADEETAATGLGSPPEGLQQSGVSTIRPSLPLAPFGGHARMEIVQQPSDNVVWASVPICPHRLRGLLDLFSPFAPPDITHGSGDVENLSIHVTDRPFVENDTVRDAHEPFDDYGGSGISFGASWYPNWYRTA